MVKSNKFLTVPLVAVLSLSLLSSCGRSGGDGQDAVRVDTTPNPSPSVVQSPDTAGGGEVNNREVLTAGDEKNKQKENPKQEWNQAFLWLNFLALVILLFSADNTRKTLNGTLITLKKKKKSDDKSDLMHWEFLKNDIKEILNKINEIDTKIPIPNKHQKNWRSRLNLLPIIGKIFSPSSPRDQQEVNKEADTTLTADSLKKFHKDIVQIKNDLQEIYLKALLAQTGGLETSEALVIKHIEEIIAEVKRHNLPHKNTDNKLDQILRKLDVNYDLVRNNLTGSSRQGDSGSSSEMLNQIQEGINLLKSQSQLVTELAIIQQENKRLNLIIETLTSDKNRFGDELAAKDRPIKQLSSGDIDTIRQNYQELQKKYYELCREKDTLSQQQGTVAQENDSLKQRIKQLESELNQVKIKLDNSNQINQALGREKETLQQEKALVEQDRDRYEKAAKGQAPQPTEVPPQWQELIEAYRHKTQSISNYGTFQGEFIEDKEQERYGNTTNPVILKPNQPGEYYIVSLSENQHLLFPKNHAIPASQEFTASGLFEGYKLGNTNPFNLTMPAQVTPLDNGMWQVQRKGRLEYGK